MTEALLILLVLALVVCTTVIAAKLKKLAEGLQSLERLLGTEFDKEKRYHRELEQTEEKFQKIKENGDLAHLPMDLIPKPPEPPAIVLVAEMLRSINGHVSCLPRLAEAADKFVGTKPNPTR